MPISEQMKMEFTKALQAFTAASNEYRAGGDRAKYKKAIDCFKAIQNQYFEDLDGLTREELLIELKEAAKFDQQANQDYLPYIATGTLAPMTNPVAIPFNELEAVHDKVILAREWYRKIIEKLW